MPAEVLVADRLSKRYGPRWALREASFRLQRGESVGYLGPNGAGKSTTLKLLAGLARPTAGTITLLGRDPAERSGEARRGLGALVETPGLAPYLSGTDLLTYVARTKGIAPGDRPEAVSRAARSVRAEEALPRPFGTLSTGLARRVLLAAALVGDPEVILLDEPTVGLDPAARDDLRSVLRGLARSGRAILLSTHLLDDVQAVCDRVLFLKDGRIVGDEPVGPLTARAPDGRGGAIRLRFAGEVRPEWIREIEAAAVSVLVEGPRQLLVFHHGGETAEAEVIARAVRAGAPLSSAAPPEPDLARRYLERVGREEAT